jgi:hypothetical protein
MAKFGMRGAAAVCAWRCAGRGGGGLLLLLLLLGRGLDLKEDSVYSLGGLGSHSPTFELIFC